MEEENGDFVDAEKESNHVAPEQRICAENSKAVGAEDSSVACVGFGIIEQTCKDNTDKAFGDCSIPQEKKTNSEINAELEISDASSDEDGSINETFTPNEG
ncbi:AWS [Musa troglodytarum]|uniref:AWS n=1 Tax=Musa troglodytarum TaxID=320322 RepID=A0A9E7GEH6_9LILI|nr:AWS [Musa troglodytarum]